MSNEPSMMTPPKKKAGKKAGGNDGDGNQTSTAASLLNMQKEILEDVNKVLNQNHPLWDVLPKFCNQLNRAQTKILGQMKTRSYGKPVAPLLETTMNLQAKVMDKTVDAQSKLRDGSGKVVDAYVKTLGEIIDSSDSKSKKNTKSS